MATTNEWRATVTGKINGPKDDQVWPLLADFSNLYKIFPSDVSFSVQGSEGQPGQIRYSAGKFPSPAGGDAKVVLWAREELVAIDPKEQYVTYEILENNRGLGKFVGTMQVLPPSDGDEIKNGCVFKWTVVAAPIEGLDYEGFVGSLNQALSGIVAMIENLF